MSLEIITKRISVPELKARFFDVRSEFNWHPGLMLPNSTINVSFLKDLVTLADPTHPLTLPSTEFHVAMPPANSHYMRSVAYPLLPSMIRIV